MNLSDIISLAAVTAAVATAIVAIVIGVKDRRNAREIAIEDRRHAQRVAEGDRRSAARQSRLVFEWEAAKRLAIIEARGGHTDPVVSRDMGAETLALIALLGPDRVPHMWQRRVGKADAELRAFVEDENKEQFLRDAVEAERALNTIAEEIRALGEERG